MNNHWILPPPPKEFSGFSRILRLDQKIQQISNNFHKWQFVSGKIHLVCNRARFFIRHLHLLLVSGVCWLLWNWALSKIHEAQRRTCGSKISYPGNVNRGERSVNFETLMHQRYELHKKWGFWPEILNLATFSTRTCMIWKVKFSFSFGFVQNHLQIKP